MVNAIGVCCPLLRAVRGDTSDTSDGRTQLPPKTAGTGTVGGMCRASAGAYAGAAAATVPLRRCVPPAHRRHTGAPNRRTPGQWPGSLHKQMRPLLPGLPRVTRATALVGLTACHAFGMMRCLAGRRLAHLRHRAAQYCAVLTGAATSCGYR